MGIPSPIPPSARAHTSWRWQVHLWQLETQHGLLQPGQVLWGVPVQVRKQLAASCHSKLADWPGQVAELLRGHRRGQEAQHTVEQLDNGTGLLRGQAPQPPLSSVKEKPATELTANPVFHVLDEGLAAKVRGTGPAGDQPLHGLGNLQGKRWSDKSSCSSESAP